MKVAGIDEAGRGPVIGPMMVAGVALPENSIALLVEIGVKDSKLLSPTKRRKLYEEIVSLPNVEIECVEVSAEEIDRYRLNGGKITDLEARIMASVLDKLKPEVAYVDAASANVDAFAEKLRSYTKTRAKIVASHKAELLYPVVAAASIVAKERRERRIAELKRIYGDFGSGYVTDPRTIAFLEKFALSGKPYPPIVRRTWKTASKVLQRTLKDFSKL